MGSQSYTVTAEAVLDEMKKTQTEWKELAAWLRKKKGGGPLPISEIAEGFSVDGAMWAARVLEEAAWPSLRNLAVAFALGKGGRVKKTFAEAYPSDSASFDELLKATLAHASGSIPYEDMKKIRFEKAKALLAMKGAGHDALYAALSAAAKVPWGGAACASRAAIDAAKASVKDKDSKEAVEADEKEYQINCIRKVLG